MDLEAGGHEGHAAKPPQETGPGVAEALSKEIPTGDDQVKTDPLNTASASQSVENYHALDSGHASDDQGETAVDQLDPQPHPQEGDEPPPLAEAQLAEEQDLVADVGVCDSSHISGQSNERLSR